VILGLDGDLRQLRLVGGLFNGIDRWLATAQDQRQEEQECRDHNPAKVPEGATPTRRTLLPPW
jgi:hypothetical protein